MKRKSFAIITLMLVGFLAWMLLTQRGQQIQFILGGVLVNLGYRMQDHLESYDLAHGHKISPTDVWNEVQKQNELAAAVREWFPRSERHPLVALVVCMDARIDTNELVGDTRHYYYIIRTAGSVLAEKEEEMLELAVDNGVELILLTTHSDCAAEKVAASPEKRVRFPALASAVDERDASIRHFLDRPMIADAIAQEKLAVKLMNIDTMTERLLPK